MKTETICPFRCVQCERAVEGRSGAPADVWAVFTHGAKSAALCCSEECGESMLVVRALEEC